MDHQIFLAINGWAGKLAVLDALGIFLADKFLYVFALVIFALWFNKKIRVNVYLALASVMISRLVIVEILKRLVDRPRPYEVVTNIHQLLADNEHGMSFPSGHTVIFFSIAFSFWGTEYFWPFFVFAALGSVARVFVGVHFPLDILVSFVIAWFIVFGLKRLFKSKILS